MRLLCSKLHIQQRWDIHPIVTYFWAHCPCPSVSFAINMGYITEPAQLEICRLNSLFPLMVFSPKSVHSSCIHAFFAIFVQPGRSSDIWKYKLLGQGQLPYSLYLFNCIKARFLSLKLFSSSTADKKMKTNKPADQLILTCVVNTRCLFIDSILKMQQWLLYIHSLWKSRADKKLFEQELFPYKNI